MRKYEGEYECSSCHTGMVWDDETFSDGWNGGTESHYTVSSGNRFFCPKCGAILYTNPDGSVCEWDLSEVVE